MSRTMTGLLVVTLVLAATLGCAARYQNVRVPPRIDLSQHDVIAVVEFDTSSKGQLAELATQRFKDLARRDQGIVQMLDVRAGSAELDPAEIRSLGATHDAKTVLVGRIDVSEVKPRLDVAAALKSGTLSADVDATLTVDLVLTDTGASIWSASARARRTIGHVSVLDGKLFSFDAEDPQEAYGPLVDALVSQVTTDFRATWVRQPIPR